MSPPASWPLEWPKARARGAVQLPSPDSEPGIEARLIVRQGRELGVDLTPAQSDQLIVFARLLLRWNRVYNLTAITGIHEVVSHHLLDSLAVAVELPAAPALRVLDAGAGAGFPGIPLAIALPGHRFTLVDAVAKKCAFMTQACLELGLRNVEVLHARLEQSGGTRADVIVSRALGSLATFVGLTRHLLAADGRWIAMKGRLPRAELTELPADVVATRTVTLRIPSLDQERHLVVLQPVTRRPEQST
jgi:16S rRNA (guanine527-N7)-methyltransferase